ncbi:MAG TPA: PLP-dependent aminotransferase family protein [Caulobacteraceae bacterium]|nr:PLP-dependent aminotransferase family protein [Caulobacteraceae bacterium]
MRTSAQWRPDIADGQGRLSDRIVAALAADVASGKLAPDVKLPTQRRMAEMLGVGVGTVTRAYLEAEARGLVSATVGRGTYVAGQAERLEGSGDSPIDLAMNVAPAGRAEAHLTEALGRVRRRSDLRAHLGYAPQGGFESHRRAGARWLTDTANLGGLDWKRVIVTGGAQQAIAVSLMAASRPGAPLIVEALTFSGVKTLAATFDHRLYGAAMDAEGLTPEGLEIAVAASGARVAYVQPLQNPTGRMMGTARRHAIVDVARRRDLLLIEDDLYGAYAAELGRPPLALLAPERTFYVTGLSKSLTPGLRVGYCVPPQGGDWMERCTTALRGIAFGSPSLGGLIGVQWIEDGTAYEILDDHRREFARRTAAALDVLGDLVVRPPYAAATELWAPMSELEAERAAARALREHVQVTPPSALTAPGCSEFGLRLCLGAAPSLAVLQEALGIVARILAETEEPALEVV